MKVEDGAEPAREGEPGEPAAGSGPRPAGLARAARRGPPRGRAPALSGTCPLLSPALALRGRGGSERLNGRSALAAGTITLLSFGL